MLRLSVLLIVWISLVASSPAARGQDIEPDDIAEILRLRTPDQIESLRYVKYALIAIGLGVTIWGVHRAYESRAGASSRTAKRGRSRGRSLRGHGLGPVERDFIARLAERVEVDAQVLVTDRAAFERAVEHCRDIFHDDPRQERVLISARARLGWVGSPTASPAAPVAIPTRNTGAQGLDLNQEVEIFGTGDHAGRCARAVLVHRDQIYLIFRLLESGGSTSWTAGDRLQVYYWRANDAGYLLQSDIKEVRTQGPGFLILGVPETVERRQKRIYVRVPFREQVEFLHIPLGDASELIGAARSGGLFTGHIEDISAGGFRISTEVQLLEGDYLSLPRFSAVEGEEILARVAGTLAPGERGTNRYGVQYVGLPVALRDRITRRVFELQRAQILERQAVATAAVSSSSAVDEDSEIASVNPVKDAADIVSTGEHSAPESSIAEPPPSEAEMSELGPSDPGLASSADSAVPESPSPPVEDETPEAEDIVVQVDDDAEDPDSSGS